DARVLEPRLESVGEVSAADQSRAGEADVEITEHATHGECARPDFEVFHFLRGITTAAHGTDGCADNHVGHDAVLEQFAHDADMRETARGAAAQRKTDGRTGYGRLWLRGRFRCTVTITRSREQSLEYQTSSPCPRSARERSS